jgi:hypothetical protein
LKRILQWLKPRPSAEPEAPDLFVLMNMAWMGQAVFVATKLGVADHLVSGPKTAHELAQLIGADEVALQQVLRALAGFGIFATDESNRFCLTPSAEPLTSEQEPWQRLYVLLWGEQLYPACGQMLEMTRTGRVAFEFAHGKPLYDYYKATPEAGDRFVSFMNAVTDWQSEVVAAALDCGPYRHVVDVGGGRASMITALLQANVHLQGTILDQPHMAELVAQRIDSADLSDRCRFVGGSFLEEVPPGGDLYLIKHVLHDWPDADVTTILRNICAAMPDEATLVIVEGVLDEANGVDRVVKTRDLEQMIWTGGKARSKQEFDGLLGSAGLQLNEIQRTSLIDACLIFCTKAG